MQAAVKKQGLFQFTPLREGRLEEAVLQQAQQEAISIHAPAGGAT